MKDRMVTMPELALLAGTRAALGAGLGLLVADHLHDGKRRAAGWTLLLIGALTTIPLAADILFRHGEEEAASTAPARGNNGRVAETHRPRAARRRPAKRHVIRPMTTVA